MGQYIQVGICYKFNVMKDDLIKCNMDKGDLIKAMSKKIDIDCYNIEEINDEYEFKIKDEVFSSVELISFLKEQYSFFDVEEEEGIFNDISKLNSYEDIVRFAEEKPYENFQHSRSLEEVSFTHWKSFTVKYYHIIFFMNGKAYMECYNELLRYIEKLIRNKNNHKISGAVKAFLD